MGLSCSTLGSYANNIFVGKSEGKGPLGRPRCRWEDSIRMYLNKGVDCIHVAHDRLSSGPLWTR